MTTPTREYVFEILHSMDDEAAFFAKMGKFFASAAVRRECGGYPLNDGLRYRWFTVRHTNSTRILGFISIEKLLDVVRIREGYIRAEVRNRGLFRELRARVLAYIDNLGLAAKVQVRQSSVPFLTPHGFQVQGTRGNWVTLRRSEYASRRRIAEPSHSAIS